MKWKSLLFLLSLVLIGGTGLTSCSKDDDDDKKENNSEQESIVGVWGSEMHKSEFGYSRSFWVFEDNGYWAIIRASYDQNYKSKGAFSFDVLKYSIIDDIIYRNDSPNKFSLKKNTLTFDGDNTVFKRVDRNEVKEFVESPFDIFPGVWESERIKRNDGTFEQRYIIIDGKAKASDLYVYYKSNGYYDKSYIYYGEWDFFKLIFTLETSRPSPDYMTYFLAIGDKLFLSWYDNNNSLQSIDFERIDRSKIQDYIDNAIQH